MSKSSVPKSQKLFQGFTTFYKFRDAQGDEVLAGGYVYYVEGQRLDVFSPGVLAAVLHGPYGRLQYWFERRGFPRPMYRLEGDNRGRWARRCGWYSRAQITTALRIYRETVVIHGASGFDDFVRLFTEVFYAVDAPSELHGRLLKATKAAIEAAKGEEHEEHED